MGLLDDAIRQHLELKRRHGADPGDVAKLEHEAFGPVEREEALAVPEQAEPSTPVFASRDDSSDEDDEVARGEQDAYEETEREAEEDWSERPAAEAPPPPVEELPEHDEPAPLGGGSVRMDDAAPTGRQEPGDAAAQDELEETPEFLQETPEHDRLWFEQKPPRDFDF